MQIKIIFIGMKLIKTIKHLIEEAEENLYLASQKSSNPKELEKLEKEVEDSIRLLKIYKKIGQKD
jgi:dihydroxyacetone kinase-like predicted kinase